MGVKERRARHHAAIEQRILETSTNFFCIVEMATTRSHARVDSRLAARDSEPKRVRISG
jgi:hypothetical protein